MLASANGCARFPAVSVVGEECGLALHRLADFRPLVPQGVEAGVFVLVFGAEARDGFHVAGLAIGYAPDLSPGATTIVLARAACLLVLGLVRLLRSGRA